MNILLIGNGFDLAHGLPTSYKDFLNFCKDEMVKTVQKNGVYDKFKDNIWLQYFWIRQSDLGENWIDFESEISRVIQAVNNLRTLYIEGGGFQDFNEREHRLLISFIRKVKGNLNQILSIEKIDIFSKQLYWDLERLTRALELYISEIINETVTKEKHSVKIILDALKPDRVLSFNYSNTYERMYGSESVIYCYIHGKADSDRPVEMSDLVLGIDEYLEGEEKNRDLSFLPFKKYYQRIYKGPDNSYLDWVDEIKKGGEHTLTIFGHSLDITDRDVLRLFIDNDNVQTKIYYYQRSENDKTELGKLIRNLIGLLGQDELIRRTGGAHKTIEFLPYCPSKTKELKSSGQTDGERTAP